MALTTVGNVKTFIGLTTTADDAFLDLVLPAVEAEVKKYIDRDIESTSYVDWYGGNWSNILSLNEFPVTSISEVKEDLQGGSGAITGSFSSTTILTAGSDYTTVKDGRNQLIETGRLFRMNGVWQGWYRRKGGLLTPTRVPSEGTIKVTYTAGYAAGAIPKDIQMAVWSLCAQIRQARKRGGQPISSESLAEYSYSLSQMNWNELILGTVKQLLSRYRRIRSRHRVLS